MYVSCEIQLPPNQRRPSNFAMLPRVSSCAENEDVVAVPYCSEFLPDVNLVQNHTNSFDAATRKLALSGRSTEIYCYPISWEKGKRSKSSWMFFHAFSRFFTLFHAFSRFSRFFMICHDFSRLLTLFHAFSCFLTHFHVFSCFFTLFHDFSRFFKLLYVFSRKFYSFWYLVFGNLFSAIPNVGNILTICRLF